MYCRTHPFSYKKSNLDQLSCFLLGVRYCWYLRNDAHGPEIAGAGISVQWQHMFQVWGYDRRRVSVGQIEESAYVAVRCKLISLVKLLRVVTSKSNA